MIVWWISINLLREVFIIAAISIRNWVVMQLIPVHLNSGSADEYSKSTSKSTHNMQTVGKLALCISNMFI